MDMLEGRKMMENFIFKIINYIILKIINYDNDE
jgi:hypothetical protein